METDAFGQTEIRDLVARTRDAFAAHRDEIDALNVFPVPDGDTGTNLYLTARSAIDEAEDDEPHSLARGALLGARGNSGVIFSQVLRGLAEAFAEHGELDLPGIVDALGRGETYAYEAVAKPVEGTMLTVIRVAAQTAADSSSSSLEAVLSEVADAVTEAVARTPEQLDALREAGVVDAGARGFEVFSHTLLGLVRGEPAPDGDVPEAVVHRTGAVATRETGSLEYRFEVQYLLDAAEDDATGLRERLESIGDSVVVVCSGDLLNVHVHTNEIGQAIEEGIALGRPSRIQVISFEDQIAAAAGRPEADDPPPAEDTPSLGCVVVLPGPGLREVAEELGATVLDGAAGDLPSVADLLNAIGETSAERVVVLPGHRNIVPTAEQAAAVSEAERGRTIEVVASATSPTRALAALAVWDPDDELEAVVAAMEDAAAAGESGEIVAAVRDAQTPIGDVEAGTYLAVLDGDVVDADEDPIAALSALVAACGCAQAEVITLVVGADVDDDERSRALDVLESAGDAEVEVIDGGQRPARYLLGAEA